MVVSVNTNAGAQVALRNLNALGADLASAQTRVSTGLKVSSAFDNGAVFAIAQGLRSDISAISTVNGQLAAAKGLIGVSVSALTSMSTSLRDLRGVLVQLADDNVTGNARAQLNAQYLTLATAITDAALHASYDGKNLLRTYVASGPTYTTDTVNVIADTQARQITIGLPAGQVLLGDGGDVNAHPTVTGGATGYTQYIQQAPPTVASATALLTGTGNSLPHLETAIGEALNTFAAQSRLLDNQITLNNAISDGTTEGLGSLVDADLAKESARLQALQIKQQLGAQALGIANQAPQLLLSLFR